MFEEESLTLLLVWVVSSSPPRALASSSMIMCTFWMMLTQKMLRTIFVINRNNYEPDILGAMQTYLAPKRTLDIWPCSEKEQSGKPCTKCNGYEVKRSWAFLPWRESPAPTGSLAAGNTPGSPGGAQGSSHLAPVTLVHLCTELTNIIVTGESSYKLESSF